MPRPLTVFIAILCVGALLSGFLVPLVGDRGLYWIGLLVLAGIVAVLARGRRGRSGGGPSFLAESEFLCDSCRYDNVRDCSHAERPNAKRCDDYRAR